MGLLDRFKSSPKDRFAQLALTLTHASGHRDAYYVAEEFAIVVGAGRINLQNAFAESESATTLEQRDALNRLIRIVTQPKAELPWTEALSRLRPVLRRSSFGLAGVERMAVARRPFLPFLAEMMVIDLPESMHYVAAGHLDSWGVDAEEAFAVARQNMSGLAGRMVEGARADASEGGGKLVRMIDDGNAYYASLLLVDGWLGAMTDAYGMPVAAFVPDTSGLLLAVAEIDDLTKLMDMVMEQYRESNRNISPCAYVADGSGRVVPVPISTSRSDAAAVRLAELTLAKHEYDAQQAHLAAIFEKSQIPVFVSTFGAFERPGEAPMSVCAWTDGIEQLLPRTDYVNFTRGGTPGPRVRWHVVAEHADLNPDPEFDPARYRVGDWPDATVMAELAKHAA